MTQTQISYDHGVSAKKLIGATIGAFFDGQVEKYREREALVVKHQDVRWTWGELGRRVYDLAAGLKMLWPEACGPVFHLLSHTSARTPAPIPTCQLHRWVRTPVS